MRVSVFIVRGCVNVYHYCVYIDDLPSQTAFSLCRYLALDMQFFIVAVPLIYTLHHRPRAALAAIVLLAVTGVEKLRVDRCEWVWLYGCRLTLDVCDYRCGCGCDYRCGCEREFGMYGWI